MAVALGAQPSPPPSLLPGICAPQCSDTVLVGCTWAWKAIVDGGCTSGLHGSPRRPNKAKVNGDRSLQRSPRIPLEMPTTPWHTLHLPGFPLTPRIPWTPGIVERAGGRPQGVAKAFLEGRRPEPCSGVSTPPSPQPASVVRGSVPALASEGAVLLLHVQPPSLPAWWGRKRVYTCM